MNNILLQENNHKRYVSRQANIALLICFLPFILMLAIEIGISYIEFNISSGLEYLLFSIFLNIVMLVPPFLIAMFVFKRFHTGKTIYLNKRSCPQKPALYIFGTIGIGLSISMLISILFPDFSDMYSAEYGFYPDTPLEIVLLYVSNCVLPAVLEEWACRGIICKNLLPYSRKGAIIVSSLLFAIVHIDPPRIIITFFMGILLAVCYEHTGSLKIPIIIHFINNAYSTTSSLIGSQTFSSQLFVVLAFFTLIITGIVAIAFYASRGLSKKRINFQKPSNIGYLISAPRFSLKFFLNPGFIPFALLYAYFYYINFVAERI